MSMSEGLKNFLESSTIHGLVYWSTTKKVSRLFWILVVITGFSGAGYMIQQSFDSWNESPIKTTIETLPISEVAHPNIMVCPPKNTYTNLNYDLEQAENKTIDFEKHSFDMNDDFVKHFQKLDYEKHAIDYQQGFREKDRYRNWYTKSR